MATKGKLVLISSSPSNGAVAALALATAMRRQGEPIDVCLLQDGVLCALQGNDTAAAAAVGHALQAGVGLRFLEADLVARGFSQADARGGAVPLDYGELVGMMLAEEWETLGAF